MTVNGFSSVSGTVANYYNSAVQNGSGVTTNGAAVLQGLPVDILELGSKSLFTGVGIGRQIYTSNKAIQAPNGTVTKVTHGNAGLFKTGKNSAIFSGLVSLAKNSYDLINGTITGSRAGGNISSDIVGGIGSGLLAAGVGSLAASSIASSMGAGVVGMIVGTAAFIGGDILYRKSGAYQLISDGVTKFIDRMLGRVSDPGGW
jgi:hypothetical protein